MVLDGSRVVVGEIRSERVGERVIITIAQPRRKNALSPKMWDELAAAVSAADREPGVRTIVVRGEGQDFSTGVDLASTWSELGRVAPTEITDDAERALRGTRAVTVAVVRGHCVGGGLMIAAACHFRLSSVSASYAITPARLGVIYPASSVQRVVSLAGLSAARRMLVAGETLDAAGAHAVGLVDHVFDDDDVERRAEEFLARLERLAPLSQRCANEFLDGGGPTAETPMEASRRWERVAREDPEQRRRIEGFLARKTS